MKDARERLVVDLPLALAGAQAPVDVLVVGEVRLVEQPDVAQRLGAQQDAAARDDVHLLAAVEALGGQPVHALELHHVALVEVHLEVRHVEQLRPVEAEDLAGDGRGARAVAHDREQRLAGSRAPRACRC